MADASFSINGLKLEKAMFVFELLIFAGGIATTCLAINATTSVKSQCPITGC